MIKNKRLTLVLLSVLFVLTVTCGITLSMLASATDQKSNVFVPSDNIKVRLSEPNWEAAEAIKLVPGKTVRKDPMITNICDIDEYAAIRLTFRYENGNVMSNSDLLELLKWMDITWNNKWVLCGGTLTPSAVSQPLVFYYQDMLTPGMTSEAIFDSVYIKNKFDTPALTEEALDFLKSLGRFRIGIEGAAVQALGVNSAADAADTLKSLFPS